MTCFAMMSTMNFYPLNNSYYRKSVMNEKLIHNKYQITAKNKFKKLRPEESEILSLVF